MSRRFFIRDTCGSRRAVCRRAQGTPTPFVSAHFPTSLTRRRWWARPTAGSTKPWDLRSKCSGPASTPVLRPSKPCSRGAIDMTYVGPNPAINGYVRSNGEAVARCRGSGQRGRIADRAQRFRHQKPEDFHGKRVASPQFGNTQDVALRNWLKNHGLKTNDKGGDVQIVPMANPDQLTLFLKKDLDAAWAPEPWATRLIHEGNGRLFVDERTLWPNGQFVIGLLVVNTKVSKTSSRPGQELDSCQRRSDRLDQRSSRRSEEDS